MNSRSSDADAARIRVITAWLKISAYVISGLPTVPYTQLRYVTCLDLGRSGAVVTQGWERRVDKTGSEALKRLINTRVIYPPADGTAEALLASSSTNLVERAGRLDGTKAGPDPVPGRAA